MLAMRVSNGSMIKDIPNLNGRARRSCKLGLVVVLHRHLLEPPLVMERGGVRVGGILALFRRRLPLLGFSRKRQLSPGLDRLLRIAPWPMVVLGRVGLIMLVMVMDRFRGEVMNDS
jgi:hypothetical protein